MNKHLAVSEHLIIYFRLSLLLFKGNDVKACLVFRSPIFIQLPTLFLVSSGLLGCTCLSQISGNYLDVGTLNNLPNFTTFLARHMASTVALAVC